MVLVNCFKKGYALPRNDDDICEILSEPYAEECQRRCQMNEQCVQFTLVNKTNDVGDYEAECCLSSKASSQYNSVDGAISGPKRCGRKNIFLFFQINIDKSIP